MDNQEGMTLVEVLATLILLTLVGGVIWTTVSIASQFNIKETKSLHLQQEANYIIAELQRIHRQCATYRLSINENSVEVNNCVDKSGAPLDFNGVISEGHLYHPEINQRKVKSIKNDLNILEFTISDLKNNQISVSVPIVVSRYLTDYKDRGESNEETAK